ncbi:V-type ATP synthase subunit C [Candidatus Norongarragalina meridionalis]|nr:V-type ATP synthase subunit C [Candidatus Norongarragalina meridionalis]
MDLSYAYANARIKAMKSKLLDANTVREMMDVGTIEEVIEILEESPYKKAFVDCSTRYKGLTLVAKALHQDGVEMRRTIMKFMPQAGVPMYRTDMREWAIRDIKHVVSEKAIGREPSLDDLMLIDDAEAPLLRAMIAANGAEGAIAVLERSGYAPAIASAKEEYAKRKDFRVLLDALDRSYYAEIAALAKSTDDVQAKAIIESRIASVNVMTVLRMKRDGLQNEAISANLLPGGNASFERRLMDAKDYAACVAVVREKYGIDEKIAAKALDGKLSALEVELDRRRMGKILKESRISMLSFGAILGFIYLKNTEVDNIRKIAYGTVFGLKDEMREMVFAVGGN